ncbi:MAG: iron ABC transporter permease [Clostridia bacterium]|nr:iron ABC transporter permease [Clostridia bacterium]
MMWDKSWIVDVKWIIILLIVDFLLLFQLMPLVYMVIKAFFPEGSFSLETFARLYTYQLNLDALTNTLIAAGCTMVLGTLLAFPLAWLVGRTNLYGKKFFRALFVLTYMVPPYVGAMAWLRLLNPNVGTINQWLRVLFHLSDAPGPLNVYTLPGMIWVLTSFYYPYAFITISRAMEKMDPSLEEASRISGGSPLKTLFTITLPMMMPSLIAGALLVFVSAASCYGIPSIIGSPGRVHTVTTRIVEYVSLGQQALNDATGMAVFLMVIALIILFISDVVLAKRQYITVSGKSVRPAIVDLRSWRVPLTVIVSVFAVIMIFIPFATIFATSFKIDIGKGMFETNNFTWTNWTTVFGRTETMNCLKNSLIFASVTATVGIAIACTMSYLLQRTRVKGRKIPDFLITLGSGTPSVVIALGLIMTMKGNFGINIYNTAYIMIIAYLIKYLMMGMRTVVSAMSQIHASLEECSQIAGASWLRTMFRITGPLIFPSIAAGWFLIFIPSFYELSMTTLLYSSTTKTIGFQLYEYWTFTSQPMSCAMAFGILLIVVALNFVLNRLTKGEFSI